MPKDVKKEAGEACEAMDQAGYQPVFQKQAMNAVYMLYERGRGDAVLTVSSSLGTRFYRLVEVSIQKEAGSVKGE